METKTYKEAVPELERLVEEMNSAQLDIDQLCTKLKAAKELIAFCQKRLYEVDEELKRLLDEGN